MTENMSDNSPATKKRKANDGRAAAVPPHGSGDGFLSSWLRYFYGRSSQMDRMENMMSRMEEKCSRLEAECSSLKNELNDVKKIQLQQFEYNNMIVKNQGWEYSTIVYSADYWVENGYDDDVATYLAECSEYLKSLTEKIMRGEFPNDHGINKKGFYRKGIDLDWDEDDPILDLFSGHIMIPHWREFAGALKQFTPAFGILPDGSESIFTLENIQLPGDVPGLLKDALMNKPFQTLRFVNKEDVGDNEGMSVDSIMEIMKSNKHLRELTIGNNLIQLDHIAKICSAVRYGSIVDLDLRNCFQNGLGDAMMASLLTSGGLARLERFSFITNGITSNGITLLANFLATNPMLKELNLSSNDLSGDCVDLLANALRSNTSLRFLNLSENTISDSGKKAFDLVVHDDSSLNSIANTNHSCRVYVVGFGCWNEYRVWRDGAWRETPESLNRARKIYNLLSTRNKSMSMSNVQHFDEIDIKLLPSILEAVQRYAIAIHRAGYVRVEPLSIVYEVMRKWDKAFPLYTDVGDKDSID